MRKRFNDGRFWERAQAGEFSETVESEAPPNPKCGFPAGTLSQIVAYRDAEGRRIAVVHQYLRQDGKLAASGKPDPKLLFDGGVLYAVEKRSPQKAKAKRQGRSRHKPRK